MEGHCQKGHESPAYRDGLAPGRGNGKVSARSATPHRNAAAKCETMRNAPSMQHLDRNFDQTIA